MKQAQQALILCAVVATGAAYATQQTNGVSPNAIASNAIASNAIASNAIASNAIASNGIAINGVASNQISVFRALAGKAIGQ